MWLHTLGTLVDSSQESHPALNLPDGQPLQEAKELKLLGKMRQPWV